MAHKNVPAKNLCSARYRLQVVKPKKGKGAYCRKVKHADA